MPIVLKLDTSKAVMDKVCREEELQCKNKPPRPQNKGAGLKQDKGRINSMDGSNEPIVHATRVS